MLLIGTMDSIINMILYINILPYMLCSKLSYSSKVSDTSSLNEKLAKNILQTAIPHHRLKSETALGNTTVIRNNTRHAKEEKLKQTITTDNRNKT
jgi:hypothetical protein